jgi:type III secretion protein Q
MAAAEPPPDATQSASRFEPAARLDRAEIGPRNKIFRRRRPVVIDVEGRSLEISPPRVHCPGRPEAERAVLLWSCGDREVACALDLSVLEMLVGLVQADLVDLPDGPTTALLVELVFDKALSRAEKRIGSPLTCLSVLGGDAARLPADAVSFPCRLDETDFEISLLPRGRAAADRAGFAEDLARLLGAPAPLALDPAPPVAVAFEAGALTLSRRNLRGLECGDVLIPDRFALAGGEVDVVIGRGRQAPAKLIGSELRLLAPPGRRPSMEQTHVSQSKPEAADDRVPESLAGIEIDLTFELGRSTIELAELGTLAPGYVFTLGRDPKAAIDIMAHGRRIGRGEVVRVGDTLGVRIVRLAEKEG